MEITKQLQTLLQKNTSGEVLTDLASRGRYATDASIYQTIPISVFIPKTAQDIQAAIEIAKELAIPILPRGGGTSQCGQTTGAALVIDNSPNFRNLLDLNIADGYVEVEPGMVLDHLNQALKKHHVWFPVDVSTSGQATIGGMAGNNSCGSRSIAYGNMVHNVLGIDAWLSDGKVSSFGLMQDATGRALELGRFVQQLALDHHAEIEEKWPKVLRRVAGYNLDIFNNQNEKPYTEDGRVNLSHLLVGSEGSLAYFKKLRLKLAELPQQKTLGVINFSSFYKAMDSAQHIVKLGPCAVELVDRTMIDLARTNPAFKKIIETGLKDPQAPTPEAILLVEFAGNDLSYLKQQLNKLVELMGDLGLPGSVVEMIDPLTQKNLWEVRKAGLNIMMSLKGDGKPVSFIEDCAVPLEHLAQYTNDLTEVFTKHGSRGTWYAHASVGTLHVRPILDMRRDGAAKMRIIAEEAAELVAKYKGAFSGEHGDGISRGEWIQWQFGSNINEAFRKIKNNFDPTNLFNPGKIIDPPKMDDQSLFRFPPSYKVIPIQTAFDWSSWNVQNNPLTEKTSAPGSGGDPANGFAKAIEMCNNNGHCRKFDAGTMCPSYRVTRDEKHVTRGRANTLRLALSSQLEESGLATTEVKEALDLCVGCKGCKRECPTGVDMAKMKLEFTHQYKAKHGYTLRDRLIGTLPKYAHWIANTPGLPSLFNFRNTNKAIANLLEKFTGISAQRKLPSWTKDTAFKQSFEEEFELTSLEELKNAHKPVVFWVDTFNGFFEAQNIRAALAVLKAGGFSVHLLRKENGHYCCGRTFMSTGMMDQAKASAKELMDVLMPITQQGIPIIGLEPSCVLSLRDEYLVMGLGYSAEELNQLANNSKLFEEFLFEEHKQGRLHLKLSEAKNTIQVHGHCHQKAMDTVKPLLDLLAIIPKANVQMIETSCCGMAGSFGYEVEHLEVSKQMAELSLLPSIRNQPDAIVVANGVSCRHQIHDGSEKQALHVAQVLAMHLQEKSFSTSVFSIN
jgi:FAD/FMN-containing dehydrogenase/Fe-S oxidoreductase